jgi:hypothetical protein
MRSEIPVPYQSALATSGPSAYWLRPRDHCVELTLADWECLTAVWRPCLVLMAVANRHLCARAQFGPGIRARRSGSFALLRALLISLTLVTCPSMGVKGQSEEAGSSADLMKLETVDDKAG